MSEIRIVIMGPENEAELIAFNKLCFPVDFWKEEDWHELLSDPRAVYYALLDGEKLIGNAFVYNWQGEHDYVKLMNLSVHPDRRGEGLARKLLGHVRNELTLPGIRRFCGETRETNLAMRKVFESCGWRLNKVEEGYFDNPPESAYKYVLDVE